MVGVAHRIPVLNLNDDYFAQTHIGYTYHLQVVTRAGKQAYPFFILPGLFLGFLGPILFLNLSFREAVNHLHL